MLMLQYVCHICRLCYDMTFEGQIINVSNPYLVVLTSLHKDEGVTGSKSTF
jgi:hypothetical protein